MSFMSPQLYEGQFEMCDNFVKVLTLEINQPTPRTQYPLFRAYEMMLFRSLCSFTDSPEIKIQSKIALRARIFFRRSFDH